MFQTCFWVNSSRCLVFEISKIIQNLDQKKISGHVLACTWNRHLNFLSKHCAFGQCSFKKIAFDIYWHWHFGLSSSFFLFFCWQQKNSKHFWKLICHIQSPVHGLWTPNQAFFHWNPELLGLGRQIGQIKLWDVWGIFSQTISTHFDTVSPLSMFFINPKESGL